MNQIKDTENDVKEDVMTEMAKLKAQMASIVELVGKVKKQNKQQEKKKIGFVKDWRRWKLK